MAKGRILIIDDDRIILSSLSEFLRLEGYEVEKNASKAIVLDISSYLKGSRLSLIAQCRWCRQEGPPGNYASGFEITAIAEDQRKSLLKLIDAMALG